MCLPDVWNRSMGSSVWNNSTDFWNSSMGTDNTTCTEEFSVTSHSLYRISHYIWFCVSPVIFLVGNFGNIMTIIIMCRQKSGEAVVDIYFTALAVVDLVVLDVVFLDEWIGMAFGYFIHRQSDLLCKFRNWAGGSTTLTSAWFLVSLTAHRAVSVLWPHRVNVVCTRRLVVGTLVGITIFAAAVYSHYFYGYQLRYFKEASEYICILLPGRYATFIQQTMSFINVVIYCPLPSVCIFIANTVLVWKLKSSVQEVRHRIAEKESVAAREKAASSVTLTIITMSVAYIMLTLPGSVYFIAFFIFDYSASVSVHDHARKYLVRASTVMLMYSNHAINFYLYCLTGAKFRMEFVKLFNSRTPRLTKIR